MLRDEYLVFQPSDEAEADKYGVYDNDRLSQVMAMAQNPEVINAGSNADYASSLGVGNAFYEKSTNKNTRAHFFPSIFGLPTGKLKAQIAKSPKEESSLYTAREEIPHAVMMATGRQPYRIIGEDFIVTGGHNGQLAAYMVPGTFENATHGLLQKTNGKYIIKPGVKYIRLPNGIHTSNGAQYWIDAYNKGQIDYATLNNKLDAVYNRQLSHRTDSLFDYLWNKNNDSYATTLKSLGITDGGDIKRLSSPITRRLGNFLEFISAVGEGINAAKDIKDENQKGRLKSAHKRLLTSLDGINPLKSLQHVDEDVAQKISLFNTAGNMLQKLTGVNAPNVAKSVKKEIGKTIPVVRSAAPYARKAAKTVWSWIPNSQTKDALRDNPVVKTVASFLGIR